MHLFCKNVDPKWIHEKDDPLLWQSFFQDTQNGLRRIQYSPIGLSECDTQCRIDPLPEMPDLLFLALRSKNSTDWECVARHLSGQYNVSEIASALSTLITLHEIRPKSLQVFRKFYNPLAKFKDDPMAILKVDELTS